MVAFVGNVTTELAANVKRLQDIGIKKILVNNLHPLGCTPWQARPSNYANCTDFPNMGATIHNNQLLKKVGGMDNVKILDLNTAFYNIIGPHSPGTHNIITNLFIYILLINLLFVCLFDNPII